MIRYFVVGDGLSGVGFPAPAPQVVLSVLPSEILWALKIPPGACPDETTDMTTSHLTNPAQDAGQVIGYSHSTRLSKNDSQVAGYERSRRSRNDNFFRHTVETVFI